MIAVFSTADAAVVAAVVAAVASIAGVVISTRTKRDTRQINHAVNHVGEDEPTLVERVRRIEGDTKVHRQWEWQTFQALGHQLGVTIEPPPDTKETP